MIFIHLDVIFISLFNIIMLQIKNEMIINLANQINKHDIFACYSDSDAVYQKEQRLKAQINTELSTLTIEQKNELASLINDERCLRYFDLDQLPAPVVQAQAKINRSEIFKSAWYFIAKGIYETFSEALKAAWKKAKIMIKLRTGVVTLKFRKTTGEIRTAVATLKLDTPHTPKAPAKYTPDVIKFFDRSVDGWRSCRIERILAA